MMIRIILIAAVAVHTSNAFVAPQRKAQIQSCTSLNGWFDNVKGGGSGADRLDEEWEKQQDILKNRRAPKVERDKYFAKVEKTREEASKKQQEMWGWQTKTYQKGEDPLDEWKKRRASGQISDLENQYGDPKKIGGIPFPMASFGVGGEFGVGGKFDNGGRFDLRLPYADQGYVDDDADVMGKLAGFFGGNKKKTNKPSKVPEPSKPSAAINKTKQGPKKSKFPWEK